MVKMTLSRALRYKKRVVETIRNLESDITQNNSRIDGSEAEVDVRKAMKSRQAWVVHLVDLKMKIQEATRPIQRLVLELAETKAEISFLQRVQCTHGKVIDRYGEDKAVTWFAEIRKAEKDQLVSTLQTRIDELQTKIDAFNAETTVELFPPE